MRRQTTRRILRQQRRRRVRARVHGTAARPRLSVYRSSRYVYLQLIDDEKGHTLLAVHSSKVKSSTDSPYRGKQAAAYAAGRELAKLALKQGIRHAAFDRNGYRYHGRVKAVAEGARAGGLKF
jgi:large subunit ribosomal protein L18